MTRIAINGLGRIGRTFMKLALENPALEIVAANDISDPDSLAYLIKYDSVYGKYHGSVRVEHVSDEVWLQVGAHRLRLFAERHPEALPWKALDVQIVVEASGAFETYVDARRHIDAGAAHVVLTAPAKDDDADDARLSGASPKEATADFALYPVRHFQRAERRTPLCKRSAIGVVSAVSRRWFSSQERPPSMTQGVPAG
jgi:glyceraldehyde-3-phosphate dehydrogenase/erythrose-4-phosphate dehydrogenase